MIYYAIYEGDEMGEKKQKAMLIFTIILTIIVLIIFIHTLIQYISNNDELSNNKNKTESEYTMSDGNNTVITVDEDSSIRIITEYDEDMFKGHKSLIFFWASWCSHCQDEYDVVKTAISNYQNQGYKIYVISHDYKVSELEEFMKNNDFNYEVYFDETRTIRQNINPEASSVPLTYILNEDAKLIAYHDGPITLQELNDLINKNMK